MHRDAHRHTDNNIHPDTDRQKMADGDGYIQRHCRYTQTDTVKETCTETEIQGDKYIYKTP